MHAIGDRAVTETLDAFAYAAADAGHDVAAGRHHIAHLQVVAPGDVAASPRSGSRPICRPSGPAYDEQMYRSGAARTRPERSGWQYPFGALPGRAPGW